QRSDLHRSARSRRQGQGSPSRRSQPPCRSGHRRSQPARRSEPGMSASGLMLRAEGAEVYVPDRSEVLAAVKRTTHLGICAHQDDVEIMSYHGILECFQRTDRWFTGVTMTNGSGSARDLDYKSYTDAEMIEVRRLEQKKAALIGDFSAMLLLNHKS